MRDLTRNPPKIDPERAEELITGERAWWRERGGGLKLTRPRAPRPKHYTAPAVRKAEPTQVKTETALHQSLKTKRSKGKKWEDLVQMMSLTIFVSRKFAEMDGVHRVPALDLKWAGDTTQIKLMLEKGKKTWIDECCKITEEMMEQSLELLKDDIERLSDKIDWMTWNTEQRFEQWRIEKRLKRSNTN
jgi:hypothetical protein